MKVDEHKFFREATLRICGSLEIEQALFRSFEYIRRFVPADQMMLNFIEPDSHQIVVFASADLNGGTMPGLIISLPVHWMPALRRREVFPDLTITNQPSPGTLAEIYLQGVGFPNSSLLAMRLRVEGALLGNLTIRANGFDRYRQEHLDLLALLNQPWAIALSNSRRYLELLKLKEKLADDNRYLLDQMRTIYGGEVIGAAGGLKEVMKLVRRVAPTNTPVLLLGQTVVGKEVIASCLHDFSSRRYGPFIKVNCGAIPGTLLDSELFGHEKGAFTGAVARRRGLFERAQGGTVFLDEVGELSPAAQIRLLRVLQEKEIERVGGSTTIKVDIRVIAATHRNLEEMVADGSFRKDLYYRLNVFPISIPPLKDRKRDIGELANYFLQKKHLELGHSTPPSLSPEAMAQLLAHDWPGNVRELENAIERALIVSVNGELDFARILASVVEPGGALQSGVAGHDANLDQAMRRHIQKVMGLVNGRVEGAGGAAELLGVKPSTLRHRMRKLRIPFGRRAGYG